MYRLIVNKCLGTRKAKYIFIITSDSAGLQKVFWLNKKKVRK